MRCYFMDEVFAIATEKANDVISKLKYCNDGLVKTEKIVEAVTHILESETPTDIECFYLSFSESDINDNFGAMMRVLQGSDTKRQRATIIVNRDKDVKFQRFSLIHELGHLITGHYTAVDEENHFTVSAHIQYNITTISKDEWEKDERLMNEQIANVFALKVLMPFEAFTDKLFESDDLQSIADHFGVTKDAVRSRFLLGA